MKRIINAFKLDNSYVNIYVYTIICNYQLLLTILLWGKILYINAITMLNINTNSILTINIPETLSRQIISFSTPPIDFIT